MTRSARAAASGSCVVITTMPPASARARSRSSAISVAELPAPGREVVGLMSHFASADSDAAFTELQIERFAAFMGFADGAALSEAIRTQLVRVERHYAALFESSIDLGGGRALVFTGTDDDPETLATLAEMGFTRPPPIAARIRAWHHGHVRATRDARAPAAA